MFEQAKEHPELMKSFVNTVLGSRLKKITIPPNGSAYMNARKIMPSAQCGKVDYFNRWR